MKILLHFPIIIPTDERRRDIVEVPQKALGGLSVVVGQPTRSKTSV